MDASDIHIKHQKIVNIFIESIAATVLNLNVIVLKRMPI